MDTRDESASGCALGNRRSIQLSYEVLETNSTESNRNEPPFVTTAPRRADSTERTSSQPETRDNLNWRAAPQRLAEVETDRDAALESARVWNEKAVHEASRVTEYQREVDALKAEIADHENSVALAEARWDERISAEREKTRKAEEAWATACQERDTLKTQLAQAIAAERERLIASLLQAYGPTFLPMWLRQWIDAERLRSRSTAADSKTEPAELDTDIMVGPKGGDHGA